MAIDASVGWYEAVFATHDIGFHAADGMWIASGPAPALHSAMITLEPDVGADAIRERAPDPTWGGLKDSFASVDGHALGLQPLFGATWIHRAAMVGARSDAWTVVTDPESLAEWNRRAGTEGVILPALLARRGISVLERREDGRPIGGAVIRAGAAAVECSNVHAIGGAAIDWHELAAVIGWLAPTRPIVGFERDGDLAAALDAGWQAVHPLRVWVPAP